MTALRCWNATVVSGSSCRLETASLASRAERDLERAGEQRLRRAHRARPRRHELLDDRGLGAVAERDPRAADQSATGLAGRPADDDGLAEADAGRYVEEDALVPEAACQLRRASRRRAGPAAAFELGAKAAPDPRDRGTERLEDDATRQRPQARERDRRRCLHRSSMRPATPAGSSDGDPRGRDIRRPDVRTRRRRARRRAGRGTGVQLVRLDRERLERARGGEALSPQPVRLGALGRRGLGESAVGGSETGRSDGARTGGPGVGRWLGGVASSERPLHLELHEAVELDGVLHRELLGEDLEEALDDEVRSPRSRSGRGSSGRRPGRR